MTHTLSLELNSTRFGHSITHILLNRFEKVVIAQENVFFGLLVVFADTCISWKMYVSYASLIAIR